MALRRRGFVSVGAVVTCCALAAACTAEPASTSTPAPTPAATTPTESQIERQMRLDYEAAETAYRAASLRSKIGSPGRWRSQSDTCTQGHRRRTRICDLPQSLRYVTKTLAGMRLVIRRDSRCGRDGGWQSEACRLTELRRQQRSTVLRQSTARMSLRKEMRALCAGL